MDHLKVKENDLVKDDDLVNELTKVKDKAVNILVFDTETTGLPPSKEGSFRNSLAWTCCRMVELAWTIYTPDGLVIREQSFLVKPYGFVIPQSAINIHGITQVEAFDKGFLVDTVLRTFINDIDEFNVGTLVAHNISFDDNVVLSEMWRLGLNIEPFLSLNRVCTMKSNTKTGRKWYKLCDLYKEVTGQPMINSHRAGVDVSACATIYFALNHKKP